MTAERKHFHLAKVIGHRGLADAAPENSLAGLEAAVNFGITCCEIDIQASADGVAVLWHDFSLGKIAAGKVHDHPSDFLCNLSCGQHPQTKRPEMLPTLTQALEFAREKNLQMIVEIKSKPGFVFHEVKAAIAVLAKFSDLSIIVSSFEEEVLRLLAKKLPWLPLALNVNRLPRKLSVAVNNLHFNFSYATEKKVKKWRDMGYGLYAYTVNSVERSRKLLGMGINGIITDNPSLVSVAEDRG